MNTLQQTKTVLLAIVGIVSIILSICCFSMDAGEKESNSFYGGDAYTGMQQASAATARNVQSLSKIARFGFGSTLFICGASLIVLSIPASSHKGKEQETSEKPQEATASLQLQSSDKSIDTKDIKAS